MLGLERGKVKTYEGGARRRYAYEPGIQPAVHCRKIDNKKTFVTIIVAHNASLNEAKGLALDIRRAMETGIFE